jgi:NAD(P)-dependent dehydrogenase (short-subunit alcohol dehydrogenase family)
MQETAGRAKVALVARGNRGIGREIVRGLARHGIRTYLTAREQDRASAAAAQLADETGMTVIGLGLDVTDPDSARAAVTTIEQAEGRLDIVVNNAAVEFDTTVPALEADLDLARTMFDPGAPFSAEQGAAVSIYLATLDEAGPTGSWFFMNEPKTW